jgi:hypothetical protein
MRKVQGNPEGLVLNGTHQLLLCADNGSSEKFDCSPFRYHRVRQNDLHLLSSSDEVKNAWSYTSIPHTPSLCGALFITEATFTIPKTPTNIDPPPPNIWVYRNRNENAFVRDWVKPPTSVPLIKIKLAPCLNTIP